MPDPPAGSATKWHRLGYRMAPDRLPIRSAIAVVLDDWESLPWMPTWSARGRRGDCAGEQQGESERAEGGAKPEVSGELGKHGSGLLGDVRSRDPSHRDAITVRRQSARSIREVADMPCVFVAPDRSMTCVGQCSDEALADSFGGSFSARGGIEFGEDVGDVGLGGAGADVESVADLSIRQPLGDESQHLPLPRGEQR